VPLRGDEPVRGMVLVVVLLVVVVVLVLVVLGRASAPSRG
jgi:Tfp pilus assembly protein PilX